MGRKAQLIILDSVGAARYRLAVTQDRFRRIALGMEGASESAHMGHPDFRVNGRIFATIAPAGRRGMVKLPPDEQQAFVRRNPAAFEPASGAWGRQGCTMVVFEKVDEETLGEAMTLAWKNAAGRIRRPPRRSGLRK